MSDSGRIVCILGGYGIFGGRVAQALALDTSLMQGSTAQARTVNLPTVRLADDAPRWLSTDAHTPLWDVTTTDSIQGDGSAPLNVYLRIPPDLYYGQTKNLSLHLDYRYNGEPLAPGDGVPQPLRWLTFTEKLISLKRGRREPEGGKGSG